MRNSVCIFRHSSRSITFLFIISYCCVVVGGVSANKPVMASFFSTLWNKFLGVLGKNQAGSSKYTFPDTLEGLGYQFNEKGELLDKNGERFQFVIKKDDLDYNQQRYEALGELVTEHIYKMMETDLQLERVNVPVDAEEGEAQSFIFRTKDAAHNKNLMVLIHGSGAVRAGQWTRKLIINENIDTGSQLPYIRGAIKDGFGVIVMNPNLNEATVDGKVQKIRGSESPEEHGVYVWQQFVKPAEAENIAVVAHSYGGIVACKTAHNFLEDFQKRVFSIVFTDSVHADGRELWSKPVEDFMKQRAVNFVSSSEPLNSKIEPSSSDDCLLVSAGTEEHERTSHSCIASAFEFMLNCHAVWMKNGTVTAADFFLPQDKVRSDL